MTSFLIAGLCPCNWIFGPPHPFPHPPLFHFPYPALGESDLSRLVYRFIRPGHFLLPSSVLLSISLIATLGVTFLEPCGSAFLRPSPPGSCPTRNPFYVLGLPASCIRLQFTPAYNGLPSPSHPSCIRIVHSSRFPHAISSAITTIKTVSHLTHTAILWIIPTGCICAVAIETLSASFNALAGLLLLGFVALIPASLGLSLIVTHMLIWWVVALVFRIPILLQLISSQDWSLQNEVWCAVYRDGLDILPNMAGEREVSFR